MLGFQTGSMARESLSIAPMPSMRSTGYFVSVADAAAASAPASSLSRLRLFRGDAEAFVDDGEPAPPMDRQ